MIKRVVFPEQKPLKAVTGSLFQSSAELQVIRCNKESTEIIE